MRAWYALAIVFMALAILSAVLYVMLPQLLASLSPDSSLTAEELCPDPDPCALQAQSCSEPRSDCLGGCMPSMCTWLRNLLRILAFLFPFLFALCITYGKFRSGSARP